MNRIYFPSSSHDDWKPFLADPDKQWREDFSAMAVAKSWHFAEGFPAAIKKALRQAGEPLSSLIDGRLLIFPEHKVDLPGGRGDGAPSQNDVWILAASAGGLASITVEGKVSEPFGDKSVGDWLKGSSSGKRERMAFILEHLGLTAQPPGHIRYQLLHRMASAVIEARHFHAKIALCVVQSFSPDDVGLLDFQEFVRIFHPEANAQIGQAVALGFSGDVALHTVWVRDVK